MGEIDRKALFARLKRVVIKIGTQVLTSEGSTIDPNRIRKVAREAARIRERGIDTVIVTSGAVGAGMAALKLTKRPKLLPQLQAAAAVGQNRLVHLYENAFRQYRQTVGQVLLTATDLQYRKSYVNIRNTLLTLLEYGVIPIINENDSVAVAELKRQIGENDMLAAYVANLIGAQLLVMLSDVDGLYEQYGPDGPRGEPLRVVQDGAAVFRGTSARPGSSIGSGGIATKLRAARQMLTCGEMCILAHARRHRLADLLEGCECGTLFVPERKRLRHRKRWIAFASDCTGRVVVDRGAQRALVQQDRSLLPAGVVRCEGGFGAGAAVHVVNEEGLEFARGLVRYSADELRRVLGKSSPQVEAELGRPAREVIHRDDLVLLI